MAQVGVYSWKNYQNDWHWSWSDVHLFILCSALMECPVLIHCTKNLQVTKLKKKDPASNMGYVMVVNMNPKAFFVSIIHSYVASNVNLLKARVHTRILGFFSQNSTQGTPLERLRNRSRGSFRFKFGRKCNFLGLLSVTVAAKVILSLIWFFFNF